MCPSEFDIPSLGPENKSLLLPRLILLSTLSPYMCFLIQSHSFLGEPERHGPGNPYGTKVARALIVRAGSRAMANAISPQI